MKTTTSIACLAISLLLFAARANAQTLSRDYQDGSLHFRVDPTFGLGLLSLENLPLVAPSMHALAHQYGFVNLRKASRLPDAELQNWYILEFSNIEAIEGLMRELAQLPFVTFTERRPLHRYALSPNDPLASNQWHLQNISAPAAWDLALGNPAIRVAIVDDAVRISHQDLAPNVWVNANEVPGNNVDDDGNGYIDDINGWDCADNDNNPNPPSSATNYSFSHGTHCAGIAAGATNNGKGIASISWNVRFIPVKCKASADTGPYIGFAMEGVDYAIATGAQVISMSWGGNGYSSLNQLVFSYAHDQGIVLVAAAGNDDTTAIFYPAGYQYVIGVGSTNSNNQKSGFSNYGSYIDVMAPGSNIRSTVAGNDSAYVTYDGTSMACPLVAGLCALMLSNNPTLSPDDIESCLENGCDNIDAQNPSYVGMMGAGRINAYNALECVPPLVTDFDAGITAVLSPSGYSCTPYITPFVSLTNFGQQTLTSVTIRYKFDNGPLQTYNWTGSLGTLSTTQVALSGQVLSPGLHALTVFTQNPNGQQDQSVINDQMVEQFFIIGQPISSLPFTEDFESNSFATNNWILDNPDGGTTWAITTAGGNPPGTRSAFVNCFAYNSVGQRDRLISRPIDLTNYGNIQLTWNYAHRRRSTSQRDSLILSVSNDCGQTWTRLYANGGGTGFATGNITTQSFVPNTATEWCAGNSGVNCPSLNLNAYANQTIILRFEVYNDNGNNLYIDNISLTGTLQSGTNFNAPDLVVCPNEPLTFADASTNNPTSWSWQFPGATPSTSTTQNPTVSYDTPGVYSVSLSVNGGAALTKTAYVTVVPNPSLTVNATKLVVCQGNFTDLSASGATSFAWGPSGAGLVTQTGPQVRAYPQATTTYFVTGTDAQGCSTTDSITITRDPWQPVYAITPAAGGNPFAFNFSDSSPGSVSWQWNFGDGSFSFNQNPSHTYNGPGTYHVSLFVSNGNCTVILNDTLQLASVGLPDALQSQVLLYPNPTTGLVNVALPAVYNILSLKVFDAQGRLLPSTAALIEGNKANVNLDGLPSGIYWILVASTSHEQAYLRIVKQ